MTLSINWVTKVIYVPKADMTLIQSSPIEIRELDLDVFRLALKDLEDSEEGMAFPDTHRHNTEVSVGGITLARTIEIINGYTVTFEDGQYAVNLVGANSNVGDVVNFNLVSVRSFNSAGLVHNIGGGDISDAVFDEVIESTFTFRQLFRIIFAVLAGKTSGGGTSTLTFRDLLDTKDRVTATVDVSKNRTDVTLDGE